MALAAYRNFLRATRIAFGEDLALLHAARNQGRHGLIKGASLEPGSVEAVKAVSHLNGVADMLRHNIVQGEKVEGKEDLYKLNVHEHTERGHNDTVKNPLAPSGRVKVAGG